MAKAPARRTGQQTQEELVIGKTTREAARQAGWGKGRGGSAIWDPILNQLENQDDYVIERIPPGMDFQRAKQSLSNYARSKGKPVGVERNAQHRDLMGIHLLSPKELADRRDEANRRLGDRQGRKGS